MIMNVIMHTNYIHRLINECMFSLKRIIFWYMEMEVAEKRLVMACFSHTNSGSPMWKMPTMDWAVSTWSACEGIKMSVTGTEWTVTGGGGLTRAR
jgi:hypothetical protein